MAIGARRWTRLVVPEDVMVVSFSIVVITRSEHSYP